MPGSGGVELQNGNRTELLFPATVGTVAFNASGHRFGTIVADSSLVFTDPVQNRKITLEIDGDFDLTFPVTAIPLSGRYIGVLGANFIFIQCVNIIGPVYIYTVGNDL